VKQQEIAPDISFNDGIPLRLIDTKLEVLVDRFLFVFHYLAR